MLFQKFFQGNCIIKKFLGGTLVYQKGTVWIEHVGSTVSHRSSPVPSRNSFVYLVGYPDYADTPIPLSARSCTCPGHGPLSGHKHVACVPPYMQHHVRTPHGQHVGSLCVLYGTTSWVCEEYSMEPCGARIACPTHRHLPV
jgi:hypothetical protein